jgi:hypothetical protein
MQPSADKPIWPLSLLLALGLCACASAGTTYKTPDGVLQLVAGRECNPGFLRPPGVKDCLNLQELVSPNPPLKAPIGLCPEHWRRYPANRFCLPSYRVVSCGKKTFPCDQSPGDSLRVPPGPVDCPKGTRVVAVQVPLFDADGELFLASRTGLACGPPVKHDPL